MLQELAAKKKHAEERGRWSGSTLEAVSDVLNSVNEIFALIESRFSQDEATFVVLDVKLHKGEAFRAISTRDVGCQIVLEGYDKSNSQHLSSSLNLEITLFLEKAFTSISKHGFIPWDYPITSWSYKPECPKHSNYRRLRSRNTASRTACASCSTADNAIPVVSVAVYYNVGSRNEREGRTGFAHLFEHMMFQGSENVPKAGHFQYIMKAGGTMNGTTSSERTNYYETLPANQLPLALWLESDRMRSLAVTQENLDNQREAVKEEKRLRYDNQPYGQIFDLINEMIYKNFANAHSTIGSMEHLDDATVEDVQEFFRIYYAPNNAVLVLVGSV